jgi:hypothetical protein
VGSAGEREAVAEEMVIADRSYHDPSREQGRSRVPLTAGCQTTSPGQC